MSRTASRKGLGDALSGKLPVHVRLDRLLAQGRTEDSSVLIDAHLVLLAIADLQLGGLYSTEEQEPKVSDNLSPDRASLTVDLGGLASIALGDNFLKRARDESVRLRQTSTEKENSWRRPSWSSLLPEPGCSSLAHCCKRPWSCGTKLSVSGIAPARLHEVSAWRWLFPPLAIWSHLALRRAFRRQQIAALSDDELRDNVMFSNQATGWLMVAGGALLIAIKETWDAGAALGAAEYLRWVAIVLFASAAFLAAALRMAHTGRFCCTEHPAADDQERCAPRLHTTAKRPPR